MMDVPALIREIKALPVADRRALLEALEDDLAENGEPFEVPDYHRELIAERVRLRDADPTRGEPWDVVRRRLGWNS
jgi:putative addiction module component (TIGR02574 family)